MAGGRGVSGRTCSAGSKKQAVGSGGRKSATLFRQPAICSGFFECLGHLLDAHLVRLKGDRIDLFGIPETLGNVCYTIQPFQG